MSSIEGLLKQKGVFGKFVSEETLGHILKDRTLRWSRPSSFNDPFDFQVNFNLELEDSQSATAVQVFEKKLLERPKKATREYPSSKLVNSLINDFYNGKRGLDDTRMLFKKFVDTSLAGIQKTVIDDGSSELNAIMANTLIFCTSLEIQSLLMWAHYSDDHKGAFLLFRPQKNDNWGEKLSINYDDDFPRIWKPELLAHYLTAQSNHSLFRRTEDVLTAILTKSKQWDYEKEERFIISDDAEEPLFDRPFEKDELLAVVFGCKFQTDTAVDLRNKYSSAFSKAGFFSSSTLDDQYGLRFETLK